jgi:hypothetical protein
MAHDRAAQAGGTVAGSYVAERWGWFFMGELVDNPKEALKRVTPPLGKIPLHSNISVTISGCECNGDLSTD